MTTDEDEPRDESEPAGAPPARPDLPAYVLDPLGRQSPERLETIAAYAKALAAHKRRSSGDGGDAGDAANDGAGPRGDEADSVSAADSTRRVSETELAALAERGVATDPSEYDSIPDNGAYVTIKEPKPGYRYYYWQWREGETWKNQYIAPVSDDG